MKKSLLCVALATLMTVPVLASAAPREEGQWYLAPKIGYGWSDGDRLSGNGPFLGMGWSFFFKENWAFEVEGGYHRFDERASEGQPAEWRQLSVGANVRYLLDYDYAHPYFGFAFGAGRNELRGTGVDDWGYQVGPIVGFEWDVNDAGAFRFEVGHKYTDYDDGALDSGFWDTTVSLGYSMYFGGGIDRAAPVENPPMPVADVEPITDTPMADAPADPPRDLPVSITLNGVNFDFDKCTLRGDAIAILDEAVRVLNGNDIQVEVAGHTDAVGSDAYNQTLSECRARVVSDYLSGNGVPNAKVTSVNGYGESRPIDSNDTAEGRARNRRTELNVQ